MCSTFLELVCPVRWKSGSSHASLLSRLTPSRVATLKFIGRRARDRVHPRARPRPEDTRQTRRRTPPACTSSTATAPCRPRERIQSEGKTHTKALTASSNPTKTRRHAGAPAASKRPRRGSTGGIPKSRIIPRAARQERSHHGVQDKLGLGHALGHVMKPRTFPQVNMHNVGHPAAVALDVFQVVARLVEPRRAGDPQ